ncbi:unnamed protein product [Prunus armeniaca]
MVSKLESEHAYALVTTRESHWDTMPLCYSAHEPPNASVARGAQSDNASPKNLKVTAQDSYPKCNTLFQTTFVL